MAIIFIDGQKIEVQENTNILQLCNSLGKEIPRFCYHESLKVAGNCRMCLVEIEKVAKLIPACTTKILDGMIIYTASEKVKLAREDVLELLLINHPLDCPVCDQGGECDLQDQAFLYGKGKGIFHEQKRSVSEKYMGPLIKTYMNRCIHCTKCIRFANDIAGIKDINMLGRGYELEISTLEKAIQSELSGNLIDICPVGALLSKPYLAKARKWELQITESIDVLDSVGSNIIIHTRGKDILRILPKNNRAINLEWISDKARFSHDGLNYQRLVNPMKMKKDLVDNSRQYQILTWKQANNEVASRLKLYLPEEIAVIFGNLLDCETIFIMKKMAEQLSIGLLEANQYNYKFPTNSRAHYLFNTHLERIDQADLCLLIGAHPRHIAPVLNIRIGQAVRDGNMKAFRIGQQDNQTYPIEELGSDPSILLEIMWGQHEICKFLEQASKPMLIIGSEIFRRDDALQLISIIHQIGAKYKFITPNWNGMNLLHDHATTIGALDLGVWNFQSKIDSILAKIKEGKIKLLYLLGADHFEVPKTNSLFTIYQGHHGYTAASAADMILPSATYLEKEGTYINLEGRPQQARKSVPAPGLAKADYDILLGIASSLDLDIPFYEYEELQSETLIEISRSKNNLNTSSIGLNQVYNESFAFLPYDNIATLAPQKITKSIANFYLTDVISKSSPTMLKCAREIMFS